VSKRIKLQNLARLIIYISCVYVNNVLVLLFCRFNIRSQYRYLWPFCCTWTHVYIPSSTLLATTSSKSRGRTSKLAPDQLQ